MNSVSFRFRERAQYELENNDILYLITIDEYFFELPQHQRCGWAKDHEFCAPSSAPGTLFATTNYQFPVG